MSGYYAFLKKELLESIRTYKLLILIAVFFIFGMLSPLTAKLMPDLLSSFLPEGITLTVAEPTALDAWMQFFKNTSQMGLILTVILFSGILGTELTRGTLINMLTKGLSRHAVILSKLTAMILLWTVSYMTAFVVTWGYTAYLFPNDVPPHLGLSVFCLWLFGTFLMTLFLFAATLVKSSYGALILTGAVSALLAMVNIAPLAQKYNPLILALNNTALLTNAIQPSEMYSALTVASICFPLLIAGAAVTFKKRLL